MSSNYEWNKHEVGRRIGVRMQDAERHRQSRVGKQRSGFAFPLQLAIFLGAALAVWLLSGCVASTEPSAANPERDVVIESLAPADAGSARQRMTWTMADRIRFQDRRDQLLAGQLTVVERSARPVWTMADRIRFQDRRDELLAGQTAVPEPGARPDWTMAERIQFQDRMWEQGSWR